MQLLAAQDVVVITSGSFKGLATLQGEELIPAVYENIGWSDGSTLPVGELIGYQMNGSWGLISLKNKKVGQSVYYLVLPYNDGLIKGAIKGKFSNQLFYGLIDRKGEVVVNFRYFDIVPFHEGHLISSYDQGNIAVGWLDSKLQPKIPINYQGISLLNDSV